MGLVQVATNTVTSAVASVTLTTINTDDVYMVALNNVAGTADANFNMRVTTSGTADSDSEYDKASKVFKANTSFGTTSDENEAQWRINNTVGTDTGEQTNHILYLYNFNNSSEYSFYTNESAKLNASAVLEGYQGGGVHTVTETNDGVNFFFTSGNIESGTFTLYKVV
tara:strand:- start:455 stop:958 length:504 start_codon:yes stop_codon:yes gene_type:complete